MVNTARVEPTQGGTVRGLPLATLNHISVLCRCLPSSLTFYTDVLGFVPIHRPGSLNFAGAWLYNYGIGIHLLQAEDPESLPPKKTEINPKDNHISFQCESTEAVVRQLEELGIKYVERQVEEGGIFVDQVFFHDPDDFMIEVCTCDNLPIVPLAPEGYATLGMSPACKPTTTPSSPPAAQCVPAMASGSSYVGEVEAMRSCPEHACMQV